MPRYIACLSLLLVVSFLNLRAFSQDYENNPNYYKRSYWEMHVIAGGGRIVERQGPFATYDDAKVAADRWDAKHPNNIGLLAVPKEQVEYIPIRRPGTPRSQEPATATSSTARPGSGTVPYDSLSGGRWETDCGTFYFSKGKVSHLCGGEPLTGTYSVSGNQVTINVGRATIQGQISGGQISGTIYKNGSFFRNVTMRKSW